MCVCDDKMGDMLKMWVVVDKCVVSLFRGVKVG